MVAGPAHPTPTGLAMIASQPVLATPSPVTKGTTIIRCVFGSFIYMGEMFYF